MKADSYKKYLIIILMVLMMSNYMDRYVVGLVLQNIKLDLGLSDTQLGLLTGIAFSIFYAVAGIPIARWADRGNRKTIIALSTLVWSIAVALCGVVGSFYQLMLVRVAVATGEAGLTPPAQSLIADYFNRAERPKAMAIFMLGMPLSGVVAYVIGGWLNELYGWRTTFILMGVPGIVLACLASFTLKEPRVKRLRDQPSHIASEAEQPGSASDEAPPMRAVCSHLWKSATFRHLLIAYSLASFFGTGVGKWLPAFFIRSYGIGTGELGIWLGFIYSGTGLLGGYIGGMLASRYAAHDERLQLKAISITYWVYGAAYATLFLTHNPYLGFGLMGLAFLGGNATLGPLYATIQTLVPDRMRAISMAIVMLFGNLIGSGLGPLAVGVLSDLLRPQLGEESLRYALFATCPGCLWCAWHFWRAGRNVTREVPPGRHRRVGERR